MLGVAVLQNGLHHNLNSFLNMIQVESRIGQINSSDSAIYNFLSDFQNFNQLIPADKIKDWEATEESCKFTVEGLGQTGLKMIEKEPNKLVKIGSDGGMLGFTLWIQLKSKEDNDTRIKITVKADVNAMMAPMVKKPLKQFVDTLVDQAEGLKF
jgi:carbon monoxide dehydrogenase subunit G